MGASPRRRYRRMLSVNSFFGAPLSCAALSQAVNQIGALQVPEQTQGMGRRQEVQSIRLDLVARQLDLDDIYVQDQARRCASGRHHRG